MKMNKQICKGGNTTGQGKGGGGDSKRHLVPSEMAAQEPVSERPSRCCPYGENNGRKVYGT
jgi:hypothetical protein